MKAWQAIAIAAGVLVALSGVGIMGTDVISRMAAAIKDFEGWAPGSRSYRNNNPGNLRPVGFTYAGQTGLDDEGHAIFDSFESGWAALIHQLTLAFTGRSSVYSPSDTLQDFFFKYAEGNQVPYAEYVAGQLGVTPDTTLQQIGAIA